MSAIPANTVRLLQDAIAPLDTTERRARYIAGDFLNADKVIDLDRRYRWDLLWDALQHASWDMIDGYNDAHIDTALRRIVPVLAHTCDRDDESARNCQTCYG